MHWNAAKGKAMDVTTNGQVSFWFSDIGGLPPRRAPLPGDLSVDVCIIGAGFTGLWSAYYLKQLAPALSIAVIEKNFAGFGASGRNGGWCSGEFGWSRKRYLAKGGRAGVIAFERHLRGTVSEILRICAAEGIEADILPTDELIEFHRAMAAGGVAMTTVAYCAVSLEGTTDGRNVVLGHDDVGGTREVGGVHGQRHAGGVSQLHVEVVGSSRHAQGLHRAIHVLEKDRPPIAWQRCGV